MGQPVRARSDHGHLAQARSRAGAVRQCVNAGLAQEESVSSDPRVCRVACVIPKPFSVTRILRNLQISNGLPLKPRRDCPSTIGPGVSKFYQDRGRDDERRQHQKGEGRKANVETALLKPFEHRQRRPLKLISNGFADRQKRPR